MAYDLARTGNELGIEEWVVTATLRTSALVTLCLCRMKRQTCKSKLNFAGGGDTQVSRRKVWSVITSLTLAELAMLCHCRSIQTTCPQREWTTFFFMGKDYVMDKL